MRIRTFRKRVSWLAIACAICGTITACIDCSPTMTQPPHILLISLDACRWDHLGCYDYSRNTSPFLDELAQNGTRYEYAFVNTHGTPPSHTTMLSSLYQQTHGVDLGFRVASAKLSVIPEEVTLVQELLARNGYMTLGVTAGGKMSGSLGFNRGFAQFDDRPGDIRTQSMRLLDMIDSVSSAIQPLFLFFHTYEIHSPYNPPNEYARQFSEHESSFVPTSENLLNVRKDVHKHLSENDMAHVKDLYDAGIRFSDDTLRNLFTELEARGILENCLIIITADHGEEFGDHGGVLHGDTLYEELLRVPLILSGWNVTPGRVETNLVSTIDIAPTILTSAGIPIPPAMEGRDLLAPTFHEETPDGGIVISQYGTRRYSVRTHEWKAIFSFVPTKVELYNLDLDPGEQQSIAANNMEIVDRLKKVFVDWKTRMPVLPNPVKSVLIGEEEQARLKSLGYVSD